MLYKHLLHGVFTQVRVERLTAKSNEGIKCRDELFVLFSFQPYKVAGLTSDFRKAVLELGNGFFPLIERLESARTAVGSTREKTPGRDESFPHLSSWVRGDGEGGCN